MSVTPGLTIVCSRDISVGDIHSANIADNAVDDDDFAMVTPIDAVCELRESNPEERVNVDPGSSHLTEEFVFCRERADMVIDNPYVDSLRSLAHEYIGYFIADIVVEKDIVLKEN